MDSFVLIGTRSSLVVEYEEAAARSKRPIEAAVARHSMVRLLNRSAVVQEAEFSASGTGGRFIPCAFVPEVRRDHAEFAEELGLEPADPLIDPSAILASSTRVGDGTFINTASVLGALTVVGNYVVVNRSASISHHVLLEDYVSIGPGVTLASNVRVGANTIVGTGATVMPNVRIGAGCVIAGGAVMRVNVPDDSLVSGAASTAKPLKGRRKRLFTGDEE